jgi:hypothetical protein
MAAHIPTTKLRLRLARPRALIAEGRLGASREVHYEIKRKDDEIAAWCKDNAKALFVEIDDACRDEVIRLMGLYPRLVDTAKGRSGGDPFVIALACIRTPRMIVVTEEYPGKMRIPDVCAKEGLSCIGLADLIEREDWQAG